MDVAAPGASIADAPALKPHVDAPTGPKAGAVPGPKAGAVPKNEALATIEDGTAKPDEAGIMAILAQAKAIISLFCREPISN